MIDYPVAGVYGNICFLLIIEGPNIVKSSYMILMFVGKDNGIQPFHSLHQCLLAKVRSAIYYHIAGFFLHQQ
jgi:hypothetical protein